jgi:hypothetical protein
MIMHLLRPGINMKMLVITGKKSLKIPKKYAESVNMFMVNYWNKMDRIF